MDKLVPEEERRRRRRKVSKQQVLHLLVFLPHSEFVLIPFVDFSSDAVTDTPDGTFPKSSGFISHVHLRKRPKKMFGKGRALQN